MTLATSIRKAARSLVTTFGNDVSLYTYSSATKAENDEGDITVSDWGTASTVKVVDGVNIKEALVNMGAGMESVGEDDKIARDDVTIAVNDRMTVDSVEYRVVELVPMNVQTTLIVQTVKVARVTSTTTW